MKNISISIDPPDEEEHEESDDENSFVNLDSPLKAARTTKNYDPYSRP